MRITFMILSNTKFKKTALLLPLLCFILKTSSQTVGPNNPTTAIAAADTTCQFNAIGPPMTSASAGWNSFNTYVLNSPLLNGVNPQVSWASIERTQGVYTFSTLDSQLLHFRAANKKINLVFISVAFPYLDTNLYTPAYVFTQAWATSVGQAHPLTVLHCPDDSAAGYPVVYQPQFYIAEENFMAHVIAHYANDPDIGYIRFGISTGGEAFPHCISQLPGYTDNLWISYVNRMDSFLATQNPTMNISCSLDQPGQPSTTRIDLPQGEAAAAASHSYAIGCNGWEKSDISNYNHGLETTSDYANMFAAYPSTPHELQTYLQSDPSNASQTGALTNLIPFALSVAKTGSGPIYLELYVQDWQIALDPGNANHLYGPAYKQLLTAPGTSWVNPAKAMGADNQYATAALTNTHSCDNGSCYSGNLITTGFNLNVPANAVIQGITVKALRNTTIGNCVSDLVVQLTKTGHIPLGTNHASASLWPSVGSPSYTNYGSNSDLWGSTWTPADINSPSFGVYFSVKNHDSVQAPTAEVDNIEITVSYLLPPTVSSNSPVCSGNPITLSASSVLGATYSWTGPNGFVSSSRTPTISNAVLADTGIYSVTATSGGVTSNAGTIRIVVNTTPPAPTPTSNTPVCSGSTLNLMTAALSNTTYNWTGPNSFSSSLQNPTIANVTTAAAGTYSLTLTVAGCTGSAGTNTVNVNLTPAAPNPTSNSPLCSGSTLSLITSALAGATYNWTGPNTFTSSLRNPNITNAPLTDAGTYSLTETVAGCTGAAGTTIVVIHDSSVSSITTSACNRYTLNSTTYNNTGTFTQHLNNAQGCDSLITLNLTILDTSSSNITETACNKYILNSTTYNNSGIFTQHLYNIKGCDSLITLNLTILDSTTSNITETACGKYTLNSTTYNNSGTFTQHLNNAMGCDSMITLNLTINNADTSVAQNGDTLKAIANGAIYQWLNCENSFATIAGANNQVLIPAGNGSYAVAITQTGCIDTSSCYTITETGLNHYNNPTSDIDVYPIPNNGHFTIALNGRGYKSITIYHELGNKILDVNLATEDSNRSIELNMSSYSAGIYFAQIIGTDKVVNKKIIIQK